MLTTLRYPLLAGMLLSTLALPQWSMRSGASGQGTTGVAQREGDPQQKSDPKGKQHKQQPGQPPQFGNEPPGPEPQPAKPGQPPLPQHYRRPH